MSPDTLRESVRSQLEEQYPDQYVTLVDSGELQSFLDERATLYSRRMKEVAEANPDMSEDAVSEYVYYTFIRLPDKGDEIDE